MYITSKIKKPALVFGQPRLLKISEVRNAAEAAVVQPDESMALIPGKMFGGRDYRDVGHVEQILELQNSGDHLDDVVSAFQQIQSHYKMACLNVMTTVLESEKLLAHGLAPITENSVLSVDPTLISDAFKV